MQLPLQVRRRWTLVLASALLTGCAIPPEDRPSPADSLPPGRFAAQGLGIRIGPVPWEVTFPSSALGRDLDTLRRDNLELAAARARVERARAAYGASRSESHPTLDGIADFVKTHADDSTGRRTEKAFGLEALLSWNLDLWGRNRAGREAAGLTVLQEEALLGDLALDLQCALVETWLQHRFADRLERLLRAQRDTNADLLQLLELRLTLGQSSALDVLRQRARLAAVERALPNVSAVRQRAAAAYAVLLGEFPGEVDVPTETCPDLQPLAALPTPRSLFAARPDLKAAHLALRVADQRVAAAVADRLPGLSFGWSYRTSGPNPNSVGDDSLTTLTADLLAPIFDAGRRRAVQSQREAEARAALAELEHALREAVREVEDALALEASLLEERDLVQREVELLRETVERAHLRYLNGDTPYLTVLDAMRDLQASQRLEVAVQQTLLVNRARLHRALGASGGDEGRTTDAE